MPTLKPRHIIYLIIGTLCLILLTSSAYITQMKLRGEDVAFFFVLIPTVGAFLCFTALGYAVGKVDGYIYGQAEGEAAIYRAEVNRDQEILRARKEVSDVLARRHEHLDTTNAKLRAALKADERFSH